MISIVMPTYNRSYNLYNSYEHINKALTENNIQYELIVVDDSSTDDTAVVLENLCSKYNHVTGIILRNNSGQQNATLAGIRQASFPYVVTIDDDLSYNPQSIIALFKAMDSSYSVVYGVTVDKHKKPYRELGTRIKEILFFILMKKPYGLRLTSFRIMDKETIDFICADTSPKVYISARTLQITKNIGNIPIKQLTKGESSHYNLWRLIILMINVILNYTVVSKLYHRFAKYKQYEIKEIFK